MVSTTDSTGSQSILSRRTVLCFLGAAGPVALLTACGSPSGTTTAQTSASVTTGSASATASSAAASAALTTSTAAASTSQAAATTSAAQTAAAPSSASQSGTASAGSAAIQIPDTGAKLPPGKVTLRWTESSQFSKAFLPAYWPAYEKAHPNITVQYDNLPDTDLAKVLQLAFQAGNAPDVFRLLPQIIPSAQAVTQGLVMPLDDIIPNFAKWKAAFPNGSFTEGVNVFNGKTYTFPMLGQFTWVLQFNHDYMQQAGLDPVAKPFTWDSFRAAAKTLTTQGKGKYYGLVIGGADIGRWQAYTSIMGQLAGAAGGEMNDKTGTYNYTSPGFQQAIDLLLAMKSDGSIYPGSVSINSDQARAKLPSGDAAMILNETGIQPFWIQQNPDFHFDVADLPVPSGTAGTIYSGPPGGFYWVSSKSQHAAIAGDIFTFLGSEAGQTTWQRVGGGSLPVVFPQANQVATLDQRVRRAYAYFTQIMRIGPSPEVRNPDVSKVGLELRPVTPDLGTTVQGIFTGQVSDVKKAMQDLQDRSEKELDRAIKAAQAKGAKVSRDDYVFPNWDPQKNYTQADYDTLKH